MDEQLIDQEVIEDATSETQVPDDQIEPAKEQHEPPADHPRFRQIYAQLKQKERKEQEFEAQRVQMQAEIDALKELVKTDKTDELKQKYKQAFESGDVDEQFRIQSELINQVVPKEPRKPVEPKQERRELPVDDQLAISNFTQANQWYLKDEVLAATFDAVHKRTIDDPMYSFLGVKDQLAETMRKMRTAFPEKFRQTTPPPAGGRPGVPPAGTTTQATVKLTPEQQYAANVLFSEYPKDQRDKLYLEAIGGK